LPLITTYYKIKSSSAYKTVKNFKNKKKLFKEYPLQKRGTPPKFWIGFL
jgi:hypothetical protein